MKDRHLPLFRENQNPEALFNSDGEQDIGNPLLASWGKLGRDYIYLLSELENSRVTCLLILRQIIFASDSGGYPELESHAVAGANLRSIRCAATISVCSIPEDNSLFLMFVTAPAARGGDTARSPAGDAGVRRQRRATLSLWWLILTAIARLSVRCLVARQRSAICLMPFPLIGGRYQSHPVLQAFISLLRYRTAACLRGCSGVVPDATVLAARFTINEEGLRYLRLWVNESGIRWGIDDDNVRELELPSHSGQHTWQFGLLTRMLLGMRWKAPSGSRFCSL